MGCGVTTSRNNIAIGTETMCDLTSGGNNVAIGLYPGAKLTTGGDNIHIGRCAGCANTTGGDNVSIGRGAGIGVVGTAANINIGATANKTTGSIGCIAHCMYSSGWHASDCRFKCDITDSDLGLSFINKLTPVSYKWKDGTDDKKTQYGLIAQDVKTVLDEIGKTEEQFGAYKKVEKEDLGDPDVATNSTKNSTKSGDVDLGLAYEQFISPLIKAVQELSAEVESLKEKLNG